MQKQWWVLSFWLVGCGLNVESLESGIDNAVVQKQVDASDAGLLTEASIAENVGVTPVTCEKYSCKPGCTGCDMDAGFICGYGGPDTCGSQNCGRWHASLDGGFNCSNESDMPIKFGCSGPITDLLPRCSYAGSSTGYRWYCCPRF